jgi:hypothetical protein
MAIRRRLYLYRVNPAQVALDRARIEAAGERAYRAELEALSIRDRLPGWHMRRLVEAANMMGVE